MKVETKADKEERLRKKREAEKARRKKICEDPEKHQKYLEKERVRWAQRVNEGKIKVVSDLSARDHRQAKKYERDRKRNWRSEVQKRSAVDKNPQPPALPGPTTSRQAVVAEKKSKIRQRKCYKDLAKARETNDSLKNAMAALKKRMYRLQFKNFPKKSSLENEVDSLLKDTQTNKKVIRKKLVNKNTIWALLPQSIHSIIVSLLSMDYFLILYCSIRLQVQCCLSV